MRQRVVRAIHQRLEWVTQVNTSVAKPSDLASARALGRGGFSPRKDLTP